MHMEMKYLLSSPGIAVDDATEPVFRHSFPASDFVRPEHHPPQESGVLRCSVRHTRNVFPRDKDYMGGGRGMDVPEGIEFVVREDGRGRDFARGNLAEQAIL
jgi:hypothetical protein